MITRFGFILAVLSIGALRVSADETVYRYDANEFSPRNSSHDWVCGNPCDGNCSDSIDDGHYILRFARGGSAAGYGLIIDSVKPAPEPPIDETFWAEWRFRSNCPLGNNSLLNDAHFTFTYDEVHDLVPMFGDATTSGGGNIVVSGLAIDEFHSYRMESHDGIRYTIAVDGQVYIDRIDIKNPGGVFLGMFGDGSCDGVFEVVNEWDFVRYGSISKGERIIAADPPAGDIDSDLFPDFDRFTVTFDSSNFVYVDDITVVVADGIAPTVIQTRRVDNSEPNLVEIVLDRSIPVDQTTSFTFDTGLTADCEADPPVNCVKYTLTDLGPAPVCGDGIVNQSSEACDGSDDTACPGACLPDCTCGSTEIPTVSTWGLLAMAGLLLALSRRRFARSHT